MSLPPPEPPAFNGSQYWSSAEHYNLARNFYLAGYQPDSAHTVLDREGDTSVLQPGSDTSTVSIALNNNPDQGFVGAYVQGITPAADGDLAAAVRVNPSTGTTAEVQPGLPAWSNLADLAPGTATHVLDQIIQEQHDDVLGMNLARDEQSYVGTPPSATLAQQNEVAGSTSRIAGGELLHVLEAGETGLAAVASSLGTQTAHVVPVQAQLEADRERLPVCAIEKVLETEPETVDVPCMLDSSLASVPSQPPGSPAEQAPPCQAAKVVPAAVEYIGPGDCGGNSTAVSSAIDACSDDNAVAVNVFDDKDQELAAPSSAVLADTASESAIEAASLPGLRAVPQTNATDPVLTAAALAPYLRPTPANSKEATPSSPTAANLILKLKRTVPQKGEPGLPSSPAAAALVAQLRPAPHQGEEGSPSSPTAAVLATQLRATPQSSMDDTKSTPLVQNLALLLKLTPQNGRTRSPDSPTVASLSPQLRPTSQSVTKFEGPSSPMASSLVCQLRSVSSEARPENPGSPMAALNLPALSCTGRRGSSSSGDGAHEGEANGGSRHPLVAGPVLLRWGTAVVKTPLHASVVHKPPVPPDAWRGGGSPGPVPELQSKCIVSEARRNFSPVPTAALATPMLPTVALQPVRADGEQPALPPGRQARLVNDPELLAVQQKIRLFEHP